MTSNIPSNDRLIELLVDKATQGLRFPEQSELDDFGSAKGINRQAESIELAAAAADLAMFDDGETDLPDSIRDRLLFSAGEHFSPETGESVQEPEAVKVELPPRSAQRSSNWRELISLLAAAAAIGFVLLGGWDLLPEASMQSKWDQLVQLSNLQKTDLAWNDQLHPAGQKINGSVVWDQENQSGMMHIKGLEINDPEKYQYQLWIFESADQEAPIDGGVFDISADDQFVMIDAKTRVNNSPVLYAITMEKPGGVPRSDRSRLPAIGPVTSNQSE